jgi:hypothetical protein
LLFPPWLTLNKTPLSVDTNIAIIDVAVFAALFGIALYGVIKRLKWAPVLVIGLTLAQRVIGFYIFKLNVGVAVEIVWSLMIIYFAYREYKTN